MQNQYQPQTHKVATRRKLQTLNQKSNPKHKNRRRKVAAYTTAKVATKEFFQPKTPQRTKTQKTTPNSESKTP